MPPVEAALEIQSLDEILRRGIPSTLGVARILPVVLANIVGNSTAYEISQPIGFPYVIRSLYLVGSSDAPAIANDGAISLRYTTDATADANTWGAAADLFRDYSSEFEFAVQQPIHLANLMVYVLQPGTRLIMRVRSLGGATGIRAVVAAGITPLSDLYPTG